MYEDLKKLIIFSAIIITVVWFVGLCITGVASFYYCLLIITLAPIFIAKITYRSLKTMLVSKKNSSIITLLIIIIFFGISKPISLYKDLPYALNSDYQHTKGYVQDLEHSRHTHMDSFTVNQIRFYTFNIFINEGSLCSITYLKNSLFIIDYNRELEY